MWPKIKLIQFFMSVLVTCKNEEDPIKNEGARVVTTLSGHGIRLSEAVPMRPFFRVKNGGRWRISHTRGRNLRGKCIVCLFDLTD